MYVWNDHALVGRRTNRTAALLLASFGALLAFLDVTIVNVAFPSIQSSFPRSSYGDLSWVLNSYNIVFAALLVAAGRVADLFGRRRTFTIGVFVFTVASAACAAAPGVATLVAFRALQAIGAGLLVPASLALVVEAFPAERRAHAIGIWGATAAFASGVGPPLGGLLVELDGWRLAFLVNVPLGILTLAVTGRAVVESRAPGRRRMPDWRGAALLGCAMAALTVAIVNGPTWGWGSVGVVVSFVVAAVLAAAFTWSSRSHPVPVLDPKLLRIPTFAVGNAVTFVAGMGFYAYLLNNILWLHYVWGYSLLRSGLAVAPGAVVAAVVAGILGEVADKRGYRIIAVPGAVIWSGAYVWYLSAVGTHPHFLTEWLPGQALSGIGVGMTLPIVASAALGAVPGGRYATASAVVSSTRQLGAVVGVALLVVVVGSPTPATAATAFRHGWVLSIVCFAAAAVGAVGLRQVSRAVEEEAPPPAAPEVRVRAATGEQRADDLDATSLLAALPEAARSRLLVDDALVTVEARRWLFRAGDATDALYVVRSGRLEVVGDGGVIRELGAGDVVGELGVLTGAPRSAAVRARRDSVLWRVSPERFNAVLQRDPKSLHALTRTLARQVQSNQASAAVEHTTPLPRVVAVVGIGDGAPVEQVAEQLHQELSAHLRVHVARSMTAEELHHAERDNDRVLLVAADPHKRWHSFSVRQADRVVVVASTVSDPPELLAGRTGDCNVLLVGPAASRERLIAWYDALSARLVVDARESDVTDVVSGIGRRLAGRSLGVVLAGGGARALSAIGVVEQLQASGYVVDRIAGASIGSVVAALFATGRDAAAVDAVCYEELVRRNPFNDYRMPSVSLVRGHKAEAALKRHLGDTVFEELPRELAIVSTDLIARRIAVHRRGPVSAAVRASLSLPGLLPPARVGDELHVDGGVLDNLPVRPLTEFEEGPVVAVNIAAAASIRRSGPPRMPTIGETLLRTMLMAGSGGLDEARAEATILVTPDTRGIGLLEFHQIDRAREAGRIAGEAVVEALRQQLHGPVFVPAQRGNGYVDLTSPDRGRAATPQ